MENILLGIVTDDRAYGKALALSLLSVCRSFIISIFSSNELNDNRLRLKELDIILCDCEMPDNFKGGRAVFLGKKLSMVSINREEKKFCLYRYSSGSSMVSSIFDIYSSITGRHPVNIGGNINFVAFCSWEGGTGCSTLAMAVAQELSRFHGRKVFYISLEDIESTSDFIQVHAGVKSTAMYLYHLLGKPQTGIKKEAPFLESYVIRDDFGTEAFAPSGGKNPMCDLGAAEFARVIEAVSSSGRYDMIIMDTGSSFSKPALMCLEMAEHICAVCREGRRDREDRYIQHLMCSLGEDVAERVIRIENMVDFSTEQEKDKGILDTKIKICKSDTFIREAGMTKIILEKEFGNGINRLAGMLAEPHCSN